jgi:hypothetical protein
MPDIQLLASLFSSGLRGMALLLYDFHLLFVHTTTLNSDRALAISFMSSVVQYKFGGFDVLLKVPDLTRSGDRDDERLLGQQPCERQLRRGSVFSLRKAR